MVGKIFAVSATMVVGLGLLFMPVNAAESVEDQVKNTPANTDLVGGFNIPDTIKEVIVKQYKLNKGGCFFKIDIEDKEKFAKFESIVGKYFTVKDIPDNVVFFANLDEEYFSINVNTPATLETISKAIIEFVAIDKNNTIVVKPIENQGMKGIRISEVEKSVEELLIYQKESGQLVIVSDKKGMQEWALGKNKMNADSSLMTRLPKGYQTDNGWLALDLSAKSMKELRIKSGTIVANLSGDTKEDVLLDIIADCIDANKAGEYAMEINGLPMMLLPKVFEKDMALCQDIVKAIKVEQKDSKIIINLNFPKELNEKIKTYIEKEDLNIRDNRHF